MKPPKEQEIIFGRHPIREALETGPVSKLLLSKTLKREGISEILKLAQTKKVPFYWVDRRKLDTLINGNHQGVVAYVSPIGYDTIDSLLKSSMATKQVPSLIFLDGIQDPHNIGSIIRSAVYFNVYGVVLPKWRSGSVTGTVMKSSAGAVNHIKMARVSNLVNSIERAKDKGLWIIGADMDGEPLDKVTIPTPCGLVMGSEGSGLHALVKKKCDLLIKIPRLTAAIGVDSLNVGVACGILLQKLAEKST